MQGICQFDFSLQLIVATIRLVKKLECHMLFKSSLSYVLAYSAVSYRPARNNSSLGASNISTVKSGAQQLCVGSKYQGFR